MTAGIAGDSDRGELRARGITEDLAGVVPVQVPGEELVFGGVDLSAFDTLRDRLAVVTASDLDVEGLGPDLAVGDGTIVVDGSNLRAQDVVARGDLAGDGDSVGVAIVVENSVGAPLASVLLSRGTLSVASTLGVGGQGDPVDLEELKLSLVDLGAVAVTGSEPSSGPAVVGAVPAFLTLTTATLVVPVEGDLRTGRGFGGVGRRSGILVGDDIGFVDGVAHDGLVAPALHTR